MKTVFPNTTEVARAWARQEQEYGRNRRKNLSFRGKTLYSYRTAIASFAKEKVVLISSENYSKITNSHQGCASWAARNKECRIFNVPECEATCERQHQHNIKYYAQKLIESFYKFQKCISYHNRYFWENNHHLIQIEDYCKEFNIQIPAITDVVLTNKCVADFFVNKIKQNSEKFWRAKTTKERYFNRVKSLEYSLEKLLPKQINELVKDSITKHPEAVKIMEAISLAKKLMK